MAFKFDPEEGFLNELVYPDNPPSGTAVREDFQSIPNQIRDYINQYLNYVVDASGSDAYAVTLDPAPAGYTEGLMLQFKAQAANTGACTLNVNELGVKAIKKNGGDDLETGDIAAGQVVFVIYDGTNFQMVSEPGIKAYKASNDAALNDINTEIGSINNDLDGIASDLNALTTTVSGKLDKSGGTMTGNLNMSDKIIQRPILKDYGETAVVLTGVSGSRALDLTTGNVFDLTLSGNTTLTFNNPTASGNACSFTLIIRQPATLYTVTFPASVKWNEDKVPQFTANKTAILTFVTVNGGTRWYGFSGGTMFTT